MDVKTLDGLTPEEICKKAKPIAVQMLVIKRRFGMSPAKQASAATAEADPCAALRLAVQLQQGIVDGLEDDLELEQMTLTVLVGWLAECEINNMS